MAHTSVRTGGPRHALTPRRVVAIVLAALGLAFIFQNTRRTRIQLLFWEVTTPLWLALLAVTVIGMIVGWTLQRRR
ncbi:LapA family protein [Streptomyces sp. WMMC500]|uniref:LapA family protein n=1 Tax=Streptomyces sp. WMMC500 TaxID=3015154 RepID=UPI00248BE6AF|nr:LapA family protein [Streptomyces sp. WMMC500]WBB62108.1 LapA family protein [Streptomyces sp. WMMC500]